MNFSQLFQLIADHLTFTVKMRDVCHLYIFFQSSSQISNVFVAHNMIQLDPFIHFHETTLSLYYASTIK